MKASVRSQAKAAFGQSVAYVPIVGPPLTVTGIFDNPHSESPFPGGAPVSSNRPTLGVDLADFALPPTDGDLVTIVGTIYKVIDTDEDGQGGAVLRLQKQ